MSIIDTPFMTTSRIPCLKSQGVATVIRYYNFSNSSTFPNKRLELAETEAVAANGLEIAVVFQQRQNSASDFSDLNGFAAGRAAFRHAQHSIGQPGGSGIYFSVDFDAGNNEIRNNIIPYFQGVRRAFEQEGGGNAQYRVGVYGSGLVSTTLTNEGLIELVWLAMSRGFRGTRDALDAGAFNLAQLPPARTLCGISVDFNDPNPNRPDFGPFTIDADVVAPVRVETVGNAHRVIARSGLRLREGPGAQFDIIGGLAFGQVVSVVSTTDGFAQVDVEGDGRVDGFASMSFLERV
jgi:Domain of unknown function (DUF1906)/Bacterial SH3 domain